ncbi:MAG: cytochrome P460 family protein [Alphaproteobacteria bacterium]|nr:cytochrome P460 family protein [Alphaproteobacteria bacterium]
MKRMGLLFVAVVTAAGGVAWVASSSLGQDTSGQASTGMTAGATTPTNNEIGKQVIVTTIPRGYRDWKFVSAAHEAGELNDIRVVIANDKAIRAYRAGRPFPEGSIIGRVAWKMVPSEENNKTFGQAQSFVPGDAPDWYLQFLEKDTRKYADTGGWGYSNFGKDLKPTTDAKTMYACFVFHQAVKARDYIFTKYAP